MAMKALRLGSKGDAVESWQQFLRGQGFGVLCDGDFGKLTELATRQWQAAEALVADGVVGGVTAARAVAMGWSMFEYQPDAHEPTKAMADSQKDLLFGRYDYVPAPRHDMPEAIRILGDWRKRNIVSVDLQKGPYPRSEVVQLHRLVAPQMFAAFAEIDRAGLLHLVLDIGGGYVPRFVRGSKTKLSNHARGLALDINQKWNPLGVRPPAAGQIGTVIPLVPIFRKWGFAWGGHFKSGPDGMHFEIAEIVQAPDLPIS
jgi:D-alanyl-D-alanine carboxypeptidase/Putative peptidoglycan binding domain